MLTFAMVILSPCSEAISSSTGATILHGPHHSAQKSTSTGLSLPRTSASNVASVTVLVAAPMSGPLARVDFVLVKRTARLCHSLGSFPRDMAERHSLSASHRSASRADLQPVPAAVTA